jgi:hypothetical protein
MAWEYFDVNGSFWSTSTAKLKLDAAIGYINRDTEVVSTTTGKRGPAGEIKGLVFPESPPLIEPIAPPIEQVRPEAGFKFEPRKVKKSNPGFFDVGFRDAITPTLVSLLWSLWLWVAGVVLLAGLAWWSYSVWSLARPVEFRLAGIFFGSCSMVFLAVFSTMIVRIVLEGCVVLFRIADYLKEISER